MFYRLFISTGVTVDFEESYIMDFWSKENAISTVRFYEDMAINQTEPINWMELYEMHPDKNESVLILDITF